MLCSDAEFGSDGVVNCCFFLSFWRVMIALIVAWRLIGHADMSGSLISGWLDWRFSIFFPGIVWDCVTWVCTILTRDGKRLELWETAGPALPLDWPIMATPLVFPVCTFAVSEGLVRFGCLRRRIAALMNPSPETIRKLWEWWMAGEPQEGPVDGALLSFFVIDLQVCLISRRWWTTAHKTRAGTDAFGAGWLISVANWIESSPVWGIWMAAGLDYWRWNELMSNGGAEKLGMGNL